MDRQLKFTEGLLIRHFKGKWYKFICYAEGTEDGELVAVYQAQYGGKKIYARPVKMFLSKVDRLKHPDIEEMYRFMTMEELDYQFGKGYSKVALARENVSSAE